MLIHVFFPLFCPRICRLINRDEEKEGKTREREDSLDDFDASRMLDRPPEHTNAIDLQQTASVPVNEQHQVSIEEPLVKNTSYRVQFTSKLSARGNGDGSKEAAKMRDLHRKKSSVAPRIAERTNLISYTWAFLCCSPIVYFRYWLRCVRLFYCSPRTIFTANVVRYDTHCISLLMQSDYN